MKEVIIVLILVVVLLPLSIPLVKSFSVNLIHRDSPKSPFYNASMTESDILISAAMRSNARMKSLHLATTGENKFDSRILPDGGGDYIMKLLIGEPPLETYASPDTGSDLIWFQCKPCEECYDQKIPIYDPYASTTHGVIFCYDPSCRLVEDNLRCGDDDQCEYDYNYGDNSYTIGDLATDTLSIRSEDGQLISNNKTIIGCGHENVGLYEPTSAGIVGFGGGELSLVKQLGDNFFWTFSYCLLPPDSRDSYSTLTFGDDTSYLGTVVRTNFVDKYPPTFYYLTLEGISIEEKVVKPEQFAGNIILDSGTTFTHLKNNLYYGVVAAIMDVIHASPVEDPPSPYKFCYSYGAITRYPNVTFQFYGAGIPLQLSDLHLFRRFGIFECFLMLPTDGTNVYGNLQQVNFQVEYDLFSRRATFVSKDCTKHV